ncbi:MAG: hypothetical protein IJV16_10505 [Lachnospiraceae bacterium]|nr:hypothetical protein [Lachnospiraceae bacterium]
MAYEYDEIKISQEIFYSLLKNHSLEEDKEAALFNAYLENDRIQMLVKSQGEAADSVIERYGNVIYLIPREENTYLGYSKTALKERLCKSQSTDKDYYLSQFVILLLFMEFYDGQAVSSKTRDYIRLGEFQNIISGRLKEGCDRYSEDEQEQQGIAFNAMMEAYEALRSEEGGSRKRTTKEGFLYNILKFLEEQGLVDYIERDEMIQTTKKLDNFMDWNILNKNNFNRVRKLFGETTDEDGND